MRTVRYTMLLLAILLHVGCSKNDEATTTYPITGKTETTVTLGGSATKMSFSEATGTDGFPCLKTVWSEGDGITITANPADPASARTFTIISGAGTGIGTFKCEKPSTAISSVWTIYYPSTVKCNADYNNFKFDGQTQNGDGNMDHLSALNLMRKTFDCGVICEVPAGIPFSGNGFEQSSCIRFDLSELPGQPAVKALEFEIYRYDKTPVGTDWTIDRVSDFRQSMSFTGTAPSGTLTAYMMIPPGGLELDGDHYFKVTVTGTDGKAFTTERKVTDAAIPSGTFNTIAMDRNWTPDDGTDGTWGTFQERTAPGTPNCNVVIMGDGYTAEDHADGKFVSDARRAYEHLFSIEPYKGLKDFFGVFYVNVVSQQRINTVGTYVNGACNVDTHTAFGVEFEPDSPHIVGNDDGGKPLYYAQKTGLTPEQACRSLIIVIANHECYAGTCTIYYDTEETDYCLQHSVAYVALGAPGPEQETEFHSSIAHEAGGHGFGKLGDEYIEQNLVYSDLNKGWSLLSERHRTGIYRNVYKYQQGVTRLEDTPWSSLAGVAAYAPEGIGIYEGAFAVREGFCRSTANSFMNNGLTEGGNYFNAISRKMIYYRAMRLSGMSMEEAETSFPEWDAAHLPGEGAYATTK